MKCFHHIVLLCSILFAAVASESTPILSNRVEAAKQGKGVEAADAVRNLRKRNKTTKKKNTSKKNLTPTLSPVVLPTLSPTGSVTKSPVGIGNGDDLVFIERCSDFSGDYNDSCRTCLGQGCSWTQQYKDCSDSCNVADVVCVRDETHEYPITIMVPEPIPTVVVPEFEFDPNNRNRRSLLSFEDNKSYVCYTVSLDENNQNMCSNAGKTGGCVACRTTPLLGSYMYPFNAPTCGYSKDQGCYAVAIPQLEPPEPLFCEFPKECTKWPNLLGWNSEQAQIYLFNIYGNKPNVRIELIGPEDLFTSDIRLDRIRLFYNVDEIIDEIPRTEHSNCTAALPKEWTEWPEFIGQDWEEAKMYLSDAYYALDILVVYEKDPVTSDYRLDRVFLFYDLNGKISKVPRVG